MDPAVCFCLCFLSGLVTLTGWASTPRNKFALVGNRGTRRKTPRKEGLIHHNISGSWELGPPSAVQCTKVSICFWPPAESSTQGCASKPGQSCCDHIFPTQTSSYTAGFGTNAVALCPLVASPRLSQGRGGHTAPADTPSFYFHFSLTLLCLA